MKGVLILLRGLHHGEQRLAEDLLTVADRYPTEHEIHHVATDLARWSHEHAQRLAGLPDICGAPREERHDGSFSSTLTPLAQQAPEAPGHGLEPSLMLLKDLRGLHLGATENSLAWEALAQAAQALKNSELLALASACHPQTLRQMRWTNTMIKNLAPQLLTSL